MLEGVGELLTRGIVSLVSTFEGGMTWWSLIARVIELVGTSIATPRTTAVLVGIECVAAGALYLLRRLLASPEFPGDSKEARA